LYFFLLSARESPIPAPKIEPPRTTHDDELVKEVAGLLKEQSKLYCYCDFERSKNVYNNFI